MDTTKSEAKLLAQYVEAAKNQWDYIAPRRRDQKFEENGGTILYAVDTDVVKLFTAPAEESIDKNGRKGYARIFPDDADEVSAAIGDALARFIFFQLQRDPLLVIPPMNDEIRRVFHAVSRNAEMEHEGAIRQAEEIEALLGFVQDMDEASLLETLREKAPAIFRILTESGHVNEQKRFVELFDNERMVPPDYFRKEVRPDNEMLVNALAPPNRMVQDMVDFRDLRIKWFCRARKHRSAKKSNLSLYDDAVALARVEWINQRLNDNTRLILITGDQSLFKAAQKIDRKCGKTFGACYLRHPRSYLADLVLFKSPGADSQERAADTELIDWLQLLRSSLEPDLPSSGGMSSMALLHAAEKTLEESPDLLDKFRKKWRKYSTDIMLQLTETSHNPYSEVLRKILDKDDYEALKTRLEKESRESRESVVKVFTKTGHALLLHSEESQEVLIRNAPVLRFGTFGKAQAFVKSVVTEGRLPQESLKEAKDPNDYSFYLVYGVLYAYQGMWSSAKMLAEHATRLVDEEKAKEISGREAHYLLAVAIRHTCRRPNGLEKAATHLEKAKGLLIQENHHEREEDIRYLSEDIALDLTYRLYEKFTKYAIPVGVSIRSLEEIQTAVVAALDKLDESENEEPLIREFAERNLLTNYFMATFMLMDLKYYQPDLETCNQLFDRFEKNVHSKGAQTLSQLVEITYSMAGWLSRPEYGKYRDDAEWLLKQPRRNIMLYDAKRFGYLKKILDRSDNTPRK